MARARATERSAFLREELQRLLEQALVTLGVPAARAPSLALLMITNLEGTLILARSQHELTALDVVTELGRCSTPRSDHKQTQLRGPHLTRTRDDSAA